MVFRRDATDIIQVAKSTIAGQGAFNIGVGTIPVGVMFGPYPGKFIKKADNKTESGYGWELKIGSKGWGVVDPGTKPNKVREWLAYVNSANYLWQQNIVAVQYRGEIWYRVAQPIAPGEELLTHYGPTYSKFLGIDKNYNLSKEDVAALKAQVAKETAGGPENCAAQSFAPTSAKQKIDVPSCDSNTAAARAIQMVEVLAKDKTLARLNCLQCQAIFGDPVGFENHVKQYTNKKGLMWCGKERAKPDTNKARRFQCQTCDKAFVQKAFLVKHEQSVHQKIKHACDQCEKCFTQKEAMLRHQRTVHTNVNHCACPTCGKTFGRVETLKRHIEEKHQERLSLKCSKCSKTFSRAENLKKHDEQVHLKLKPFSCPKCNKKFTRASHLNRHEKSVHKA